MEGQNELDLSREVIYHATAIAAYIVDYIRDNEELHAASVTTIAYATQMIMHFFAKGMDMDYHQFSKDYRTFLESVEDDILYLLSISDPNVN